MLGPTLDLAFHPDFDRRLAVLMPGLGPHGEADFHRFLWIRLQAVADEGLVQAFQAG